MLRSIRNMAYTSKLAINGLLVLAFLSLTLFPYHLHLHHHDDEAVAPANITTQGHVTELHGVLDPTHSEHHQDSHTIEPASDITLKSSIIKLPFAALILVLAILLPLFKRVLSLQPAAIDQRITYHRWYTTPPLRAPPLH